MEILAHYWETHPSGVRCTLCPHYCLLKDEQLSPCKARIVHQQKLYTRAYGNPIVFSIDPIERLGLFHFKPGHRTFSLSTAGCNLHCRGCKNHDISQSTPQVEPETMHPDDVIRICKEAQCESITFSYAEPIVSFEYILAIAKLAMLHKIPIILVTSAYINPAPLRQLLPLLSAVNLDLKSMSDAFYRQHCRANLKPVLETLLSLHSSHVWLETTHLLIPGINDDEASIRQLCIFLKKKQMSAVPIHFSRFFPRYKLRRLPPTSENSLLRAAQIAKENQLQYIYFENIKTKPFRTTYCPACRASLIVREGYSPNISANFNGHCPQCGSTINGIW